MLITTAEAKFSLAAFAFGAILAILFVSSFFAFTKAVEKTGAAISQTSSRLSVIVPLTLSILFLHEQPTQYQIAGILLAVITIVLFYMSIRNSSESGLNIIDYIYLLGLLSGIGLADFSIKLFQVWRPAMEKPFFLFSIFSFAYIYTALIILIKKITVNKRTLVLGAVLGIPNVFSTFFLLSALAQLPAIVVYPLVNIGIILCTAVLAVIFWQEKLNFYGKFALFSGVISIMLLGL